MTVLQGLNTLQPPKPEEMKMELAVINLYAKVLSEIADNTSNTFRNEARRLMLDLLAEESSVSGMFTDIDSRPSGSFEIYLRSQVRARIINV